MSDVIDVPAEIDPNQIEIEPYELGGCAIEDLEELIYLRAADTIAQWELADPRDAWRHTGEAPPKASAVPVPSARPYRTPEATISAFKYVVGLGDADYLARWLADHPADAPTLLKILDEGK
jgi:hypothetical protein